MALLVVTLLEIKHRALIIICIIIAIGSCGPAWASFGVNHLDIGAHYAGILMGLSNCVGSIPGFLVPILTGYIVEDTSVRLCFIISNFYIKKFFFLVKTRMEYNIYFIDNDLYISFNVLYIFCFWRITIMGIEYYR